MLAVKNPLLSKKEAIFVIYIRISVGVSLDPIPA